MNDKKTAPRRSTRSRTVDLEATEIVAGDAPDDVARQSAPVETAAAMGTAGPVEDGRSKEDDAARASIEAAFARPNPNTAKAPPQTESAGPLAGKESPANRVRRGPLLAAALLGGAVPIGIVAFLNAIGMSSVVPGFVSSDIEAGTKALQAQVAALDGKVAALGNAVENAAPTIDASALVALEDRVAKVETEGKRLASQVQSATQDAAGVSALGERMGALEKALSTAPGAGVASGGSTEGISAVLAPIEAQLGTASSEIAGLSARVSQLEASFAEISKAVEAGPRPDAAAARTLAATALRDALAGGKPFADLIGPLQSLTGNNAAIDRLKVLSAGRVATYPELLSEFESARTAVSAIGEKPADGVFGRLLQNARSLVTVEPDGPIEGNSPEAVLSRVKAGLSAGDASAALAAWQQLQQPQRSAAAAFEDRLSVRAGADSALAEIMSLLGQTGG